METTSNTILLYSSSSCSLCATDEQWVSQHNKLCHFLITFPSLHETDVFSSVDETILGTRPTSTSTINAEQIDQ